MVGCEDEIFENAYTSLTKPRPRVAPASMKRYTAWNIKYPDPKNKNGKFKYPTIHIHGKDK